MIAFSLIFGVFGMVKDLNEFPFDNDMKKAHFGTKICIYHEKTVSVYQRNTIFTVYFKKNGQYFHLITSSLYHQ
jgi:hypothetical protein